MHCKNFQADMRHTITELQCDPKASLITRMTRQSELNFYDPIDVNNTQVSALEFSEAQTGYQENESELNLADITVD